ncbi:MAG: hypothetical protein H7Y17_03500 [Chlorobia bacterium]|nr:hypothetical protein [Fimbriimonadaceae bacterium]
MPRKKTNDLTPTPSAEPKANPTKPKRTAKAEPVVEAKKPSVARKPAAAKKVAEPTPTPAPAVSKPRARKPQKSVPAAVEAVTTPEVKPASKGSRAKAKPIVEDEPKALFRRAKPRVEASLAPAPEPAKPTRSRNQRSKKTEPAVQTGDAGDFPIPTFRPRKNAAMPSAEPARARSGRSAGRQKIEKPEVFEEFIVEGEDLPNPIWRTRANGKADGSSVRKTAEETEPKERGRRRGRRERQPEGESTTAEPVISEEAVAEAPQVSFRRREKVSLLPPPKPLISTPEDAPQVVVRDGLPTLVRNGRVYPPMLFFGGSSDERSAGTVLEELRMASEAGVHLHSHFVDFEVDEDSIDANVQLAAYLLSKSVATDPESQVLFRLVFKAPRGWQQKFTKGRYLHQDGSLAEPSVCDDEFWGLASKCLQEFVKKLRALDLKNHILGVHLDRGEWFFADGWGYDTSDAAVVKFREWARMRYLDDEVMLRASWFDGHASFTDLQIPIYQPEGAEGDKFVRSSRKQRRYVDYHLFLSDATVQRIGDLAYTVKEASQGYFIVGASYGYTFEWSHPANGHLSLGKLLRTPEIDFIAGPPSYRNREPGGTAPFPGPIDSFGLNGKLYFSEEDIKTSLSGGREPDDFNPMIKTPQALDSVHWRGAGAALAHGTGINWMDLWGNGWLKTSSIWDRARKITEALTTRMASGTTEPEVCVFIDERALAYLVDPNAFTLLVQNVRESVLRAGVNAGFYLLSDLAHREKFPEAKAYIFLNAWDIRPELRVAIKSRLQRDGKVLFWLYSAGLFDSGRDSLERAREVTGIALKPQPFYSKSGTTILNRKHPLSEAFPERSIVSGTKLEPSYFAIPEDALVLGEYSQTGLPSFVVKEFTGSDDQRWTSVFLGEPMVNPALIRGLAQMAGAHIWNFTDDVVHLRPPFLTVHCASAGLRTITLPSKCSAYHLLSKQWIQTENTSLKFQATDGSTHVFLVGTSEEIENILAIDPDSLLKMATLPEKQDNTLAGDAASFDIPMMKLGEWMEGGDADEVADEWFLRPMAIEEEPAPLAQSEDRPGRRRRRRRNGDRTGSEETANFKPEYGGADDDPGISVVFRKRE